MRCGGYVIVSNLSKINDLKDIGKAVEKLKVQEKRLVDLYLSSTLDVDTINNKKEIEKLNDKKKQLDPNDDFKEYTIELISKLNCIKDNNEYLFNKDLGFSFIWNSLNRKAKKEIIAKLISSLEISREDKYNIEIINIKFKDEFISKNNEEYFKYINEILVNNNIGIKYRKAITIENIEKYHKDYFIFFNEKFEKNEYSDLDLKVFTTLVQEHFYLDGIINCSLIEDEKIIDNLFLISKTEYANV